MLKTLAEGWLLLVACGILVWLIHGVYVAARCNPKEVLITIGATLLALVTYVAVLLVIPV